MHICNTRKVPIELVPLPTAIVSDLATRSVSLAAADRSGDQRRPHRRPDRSRRAADAAGDPQAPAAGRVS
jgi:hypothetical protein